MPKMNLLSHRIPARILTVLLVATASSGGSSPILSVCDVLSSLTRLQNKEVNVLALVRNNGGTVQAFCDDCPSTLTSPGHVWPNGIYLHPSNDSVSRELKRMFSDKIDGVVVLRGILRVHLKSRKWPFGKRIISGGFGHLGVHPARLDVLSVLECRVAASTVCEFGRSLKDSDCQIAAEGGGDK
jgi:hypothetical protein